MYIIAQLSGDTDRSGLPTKFACSSLFFFLLSESSVCQWVGTSRVLIYPALAADGSGIAPGDTVTLLPALIASPCPAKFTAPVCAKICPKNVEQAVYLQRPAKADPVDVVISAPERVSPCNSLRLDLTASTGFASRKWKVVQFEVALSQPSIVSSSSTKSVAAIQSFLDSQYAFSPPASIPNTLLSPSTSYYYGVKLCNIFDECGYSNKTIEVTSAVAAFPIVTIPGKQTRQAHRYESFSLSSIVYVQSCEGSQFSDNITYSWSVFDSFGLAAPLLNSQSKDGSVFILPAFMLPTSSAYRIQVTAIYRTLSLQTSASVHVYVAVGDVVAVFLGGNSRTVRMDSTLMLDASQSYDEDVQYLTGHRCGLAFNWTCSSVDTIDGICPIVFLNSTSSSFPYNDSTLVAIEQMFVYAGRSAAYRSSTVVVTAVKDSRYGSATATLFVLPYQPAAVEINTPQPTLLHIDATRKVVISGSVEATFACNATWAIDDPSIQLASAALTPVTLSLPSGAATTKLYLAIAPNALPINSVFLFTLTCGLSTADIFVLTNHPPVPGVFSVTPPSGQAFVTPFSFSASIWSAMNMPISYQFGYLSISGEFLSLQQKSELSFATSLLPAGNSAANYAIQCQLRVFDSFSTLTTASRSIAVELVDAAANVGSALANLKLGGLNSNFIMTSLAMLGSVLNQPMDCTHAPNCMLLNRTQCTMLPNTCGPCVAGFVGNTGSGNDPCIPSTAAATAATGRGVGQCSTTAQCGVFETCILGICVAASKSCDAGCSLGGHGSCAFTSSQTGDIVKNCLIVDLSCEATCVCSSGYFGPICNTTAIEIQKQQELRTAALEGLSSLTSKQNPTSENIKNWGSNLIAFASNPYEMSSAAISLTHSIAATILVTATAAEIPSAGISGILSAIDVAAQASRIGQFDQRRLTSSSSPPAAGAVTSPAAIARATIAATAVASNQSLSPSPFLDSSTSTSTLVTFANTFALTVARELVPGEPPVAYSQPSFSTTSAISAVRANSLSVPFQSAALAAALSRSSLSQAVALSSVALPRLPAFDGPTRLTASTFSAKLFGSTSVSKFKSNLLIVQLDGSSILTTSLPSPSIVDVVLQNNAVETWGVTAATQNFTTVCAENDFSSYVHDCLDSRVRLTHSCRGKSRKLVSQCPASLLVASCSSLMPVNTGPVVASVGYSSTAGLCRLTKVTHTNATCSCSLSIISSPNTTTAVARPAFNVAHRFLSSSGSSSVTDTAAPLTATLGVVLTGALTYLEASTVAWTLPTHVPTLPTVTTNEMFSAYVLIVLWIGGLAFIALKCPIQRFYTRLNQPKQRQGNADSQLVVPLELTTSPLVTPQQAVEAYVKAFIPAVFDNNISVWSTALRMMESHHRLRQFWRSSANTTSQLAIATVLFLSEATFYLFVTGALMDAEWPGQMDPKCRLYSHIDSCLLATSPLGGNRLCQWSQPTVYNIINHTVVSSVTPVLDGTCVAAAAQYDTVVLIGIQLAALLMTVLLTITLRTVHRNFCLVSLGDGCTVVSGISDGGTNFTRRDKSRRVQPEQMNSEQGDLVVKSECMSAAESTSVNPSPCVKKSQFDIPVTHSRDEITIWQRLRIRMSRHMQAMWIVEDEKLAALRINAELTCREIALVACAHYHTISPDSVEAQKFREPQRAVLSIRSLAASLSESDKQTCSSLINTNDRSAQALLALATIGGEQEENALLAHMTEVVGESDIELKTLQPSHPARDSTAAAATGCRLLQILIEDLLGHDSLTAKTFLMQCSSPISTVATSFVIKISLILALCCVNGFTMAAIVGFGHSHNQFWLRRWLVAGLVGIIADVTLVEIAFVLIAKLLAPSLITEQVLHALDVVIGAAKGLTGDSLLVNAGGRQPSIATVAQFSFVSAHLARAVGPSIESALALAVSATSKPDITNSARHTTARQEGGVNAMAAVLSRLLLRAVTMGDNIARIFVALSIVCFMTGILVLGYFTFHSAVIASIVGISLVCGVLVCMITVSFPRPLSSAVSVTASHRIHPLVEPNHLPMQLHLPAAEQCDDVDADCDLSSPCARETHQESQQEDEIELRDMGDDVDPELLQKLRERLHVTDDNFNDDFEFGDDSLFAEISLPSDADSQDGNKYHQSSDRGDISVVSGLSDGLYGSATQLPDQRDCDEDLIDSSALFEYESSVLDSSDGQHHYDPCDDEDYDDDSIVLCRRDEVEVAEDSQSDLDDLDDVGTLEEKDSSQGPEMRRPDKFRHGQRNEELRGASPITNRVGGQPTLLGARGVLDLTGSSSRSKAAYHAILHHLDNQRDFQQREKTDFVAATKVKHRSKLHKHHHGLQHQKNHIAEREDDGSDDDKDGMEKSSSSHSSSASGGGGDSGELSDDDEKIGADQISPTPPRSLVAADAVWTLLEVPCWKS